MDKPFQISVERADISVGHAKSVSEDDPVSDSTRLELLTTPHQLVDLFEGPGRGWNHGDRDVRQHAGFGLEHTAAIAPSMKLGPNGHEARQKANGNCLC